MANREFKNYDPIKKCDVKTIFIVVATLVAIKHSRG